MDDVKERLAALGDEVVGSSPAEFSVAMKSDVARVGKLVSDANLRSK